MVSSSETSKKIVVNKKLSIVHGPSSSDNTQHHQHHQQQKKQQQIPRDNNKNNDSHRDEHRVIQQHNNNNNNNNNSNNNRYLLLKTKLTLKTTKEVTVATIISFMVAFVGAFIMTTAFTSPSTTHSNYNSSYNNIMSHIVRVTSTSTISNGYFNSIKSCYFSFSCPATTTPTPSTSITSSSSSSSSSTKTTTTASSSSTTPPPIMAVGAIRKIMEQYNYNVSTETMYRSDNNDELYGKYKEIRSKLDYTFHSKYTYERTQFQDKLIDSLLPYYNTQVFDSTNPDVICNQATRPWIVFTAGAMGAGKTHTIKVLHKQQLFPLHSFVLVDPDQIRQHLPEYKIFIETNPENAGYLTRKESGMISEIIIQTALQRQQNVLVDGTLRDSQWYKHFIVQLRQTYPMIQIGIIHVTAPTEQIFEHALERAKVTGRIVPRSLLEATIEQVPRSIQELKPLVDVTIELHNPGKKQQQQQQQHSGSSDVDNIIHNNNVNDHSGIKLLSPHGLQWDEFRTIWEQNCPIMQIPEDNYDDDEKNESEG